jgi:hypothetical protein
MRTMIIVSALLVASPASAQYIPRGQDRAALGQALQGHDFWNDYGQHRVPDMPNPYRNSWQPPQFNGYQQHDFVGGARRGYGWREYGW